MENNTLIWSGQANWERNAYIKLVENKVIFDCSDEEYGPIEFDLELLKDKIKEHDNKIHRMPPSRT